jgi:uncharacterized membrane protein
VAQFFWSEERRERELGPRIYGRWADQRLAYAPLAVWVVFGSLEFLHVAHRHRAVAVAIWAVGFGLYLAILSTNHRMNQRRAAAQPDE